MGTMDPLPLASQTLEETQWTTIHQNQERGGGNAPSNLGCSFFTKAHFTQNLQLKVSVDMVPFLYSACKRCLLPFSLELNNNIISYKGGIQNLTASTRAFSVALTTQPITFLLATIRANSL